MSSLTKFLSLNDDCMFEIFDRMSLDSLCALSQTNKRLRELSGRHFVLKNPYVVAIVNFSDLSCKTSEKEPEKQRYCNFFRRNIENVFFHKFGYVPGVDLDSVAKHMHSNCNLNLRKITFSCCKLSDELGEIIKTFLENVETVEFNWNYHHSTDKIFSGESGNFDTVLKHCTSLKHLLFDGCCVYKEIDTLLQGTYPQLEHFMCTSDAIFTMKNWKTFLRRNTNIKALTWYFWDDKNSIASFIDNINEMAHLERLYLSFCGYFDLSSICDNLQNICDQKQFNRLELKFNYENAGRMLTDFGESLRSLKRLKGIHLMDVSFPKLPPLLHVTTLQLCSILEDSFDVNHLPHLEVLYVREMTTASWNIVQYLIRNSLNLKKILIDSSNLLIGIDAAKLNAERQKLAGADTVVIYVDSCWATKTDLKHDLVKIKEVQIEYNHHSDAAPFVSDHVPDAPYGSYERPLRGSYLFERDSDSSATETTDAKAPETKSSVIDGEKKQ